MIRSIDCVLLIVGLSVRLTHAANILGVFNYCAPSPYQPIAPLIKALVARGHKLTTITSEKHFADIDGAHHIRVRKLDQILEDLGDFEFDDNMDLNKWNEAKFASHWFYNSSYSVLNDAGVKALLQDKNAHFDMVIVHVPFTDALYGFAQHFNATLVGFAPYGTTWNVDYLAGNKAPSIYEPMSPAGYSLGSSLLDKFANWIFEAEEWLLNWLVYLPPQIKLYTHFFKQTPENFHIVRKNFSLVFINQHFSLGRVRSNVPNIIEVAGIHLTDPAEPMDTALQRFLDESENGVVYFSMGVEIIAKWLPPTLLQTMLESFNKLQLRVVWKYELDTLPNITDNIYIRPLLPQRELLAHPKVKLFVTHGGMLSIIEAAYYGIPMLCLPVYYDQFGNADRMQKAGVSQTLDILTMELETTTKALKELIENPMYAHNAKQIANRIRDQPMTPLDTAIWWTEYVLRHQGAPHMRISEQDISLLHYYSVDVLSVLFGRIGITSLIVFCLGLKLSWFFTKRLHFRFTIPILK